MARNTDVIKEPVYGARQEPGLSTTRSGGVAVAGSTKELERAQDPAKDTCRFALRGIRLRSLSHGNSRSGTGQSFRRRLRADYRHCAARTPCKEPSRRT